MRQILLALVAAALVAGCADPAPTGSLATQSFTPSVTGTATIDYNAFSGANAAGPVAPDLQCSQPPEAAPVVPPCKPAYTDIKVNVTAPLAGEGNAYSVYLVNATGEMLVAELAESGAMDSTAQYTGGANLTQDLTGRFTQVELRLGGFLLATAPAGEGPQTFAVASDALGVTVTEATYLGHIMQATVAGLPTNATYQGNLYLPGPDGAAERSPAETFPIDGNGPFSYSSPSRNLSEFKEFHIHVAHSKVNLYKADVTVQED